MIRLTQALRAWGSPDFQDVLKQELDQQDSRQLPLQQGLRSSSYALDGGFSVMILRVTDEAARIRVRAGIAYSGIIAGCSCADDPTPVEPQSEYCEVQIDIDKETAEATVLLLE